MVLIKNVLSSRKRFSLLHDNKLTKLRKLSYLNRPIKTLVN